MKDVSNQVAVRLTFSVYQCKAFLLINMVVFQSVGACGHSLWFCMSVLWQINGKTAVHWAWRTMEAARRLQLPTVWLACLTTGLGRDIVV